MLRLAALLVLAISACVHGLPPSSADAQAVSAVEGAWRASGLPGPGDCLELVEVRRHDSRARYLDACDGGRPGLYGAAARDSAGCLGFALRGVIGRRVWVVHVAPGYHADPTIVGHELRHALTACHLDRPRSDPFDAGADRHVVTHRGSSLRRIVGAVFLAPRQALARQRLRDVRSAQ